MSSKHFTTIFLEKQRSSVSLFLAKRMTCNFCYRTSVNFRKSIRMSHSNFARFCFCYCLCAGSRRSFVEPQAGGKPASSPRMTSSRSAVKPPRPLSCQSVSFVVRCRRHHFKKSRSASPSGLSTVLLSKRLTPNLTSVWKQKREESQKQKSRENDALVGNF